MREEKRISLSKHGGFVLKSPHLDNKSSHVEKKTPAFDRGYQKNV